MPTPFSFRFRRFVCQFAKSNSHSLKTPAIVLSTIALLSIVSIAGCGGGSAGGGTIGQPRPSYQLSLPSNAVTISEGGTAIITVVGGPTHGYTGTISVTIGGLPSGVTATPSTFSMSGAVSVPIQLSASATAVIGNSMISVTGSDGSISPSVQFQLNVTGPQGISLSLQPTSLYLIPGVQQKVDITVNAVNGYNQLVSGTFSGLPSGVTVNSTTFSTFPGGTSSIYFTAATGASSGLVSINAGSGAITASAQLPISINTTPDFQLTTYSNNYLVVSQNATATFYLSALGYNGFSQPISVSFSGLPSGVTANPSTFFLQPGGPSQTVAISTTFSAPLVNGATITVIGSAGGLTRQLPINLSITAPSLYMTLQPTSLTVPLGSTNSFELQIGNGSTGQPSGNISIQITGVPTGVTVTPTSYQAPPQGVGFNVYVTAGTSAVNGTLTVTATYGPAQAKGTMPLVIGSANHFPAVPFSAADQLVRTDTLTPYYSFPPPNYTVYHAGTQRFFSTEAYLNHLNVLDAKTKSLVGTIVIPGAFGLDQAPDGSVLYVGTMMGDLYVVDPVQLKIVKRYASSAISQYGFPANAVYALANGKLILETYFLVPGFSWVDGNGPIALWDPNTNNITVFGQSVSGYGYNGTAPSVPTCFDRVENVILTNNRTRVLLAPVLTSEGSSQLCSLDPETDTWNLSGQISGGSGSALNTLAVSADGSVLVAYDGYRVFNLDPATFAVKTSFPVTGPQTASYAPISVLLVSPDNSSVFLTDANGSDVFDKFSLATGQQIGWTSQLSMAAEDSYSQWQPMYQAMTPNGLAAGVIPGGGIGLLDTTLTKALPVGSRFSQTQLAVPYGPPTGGTTTSWLPNLGGVPPPPLGSIYFGTNPAAEINNNGFTGLLEAVSPPGSPGPVDVRTFTTNGASQLIPDGFSYGPWVLESPTSYSTADGGGTGTLFGYGFGPQLYTGGALFIKPPSDIQVNIGGNQATVTGFSPNPYTSYFTAPVFPSNAIHYTIPPGGAGTSASFIVTNSSGSTSSSQKMSYLPAVQPFPVAGQLADGVYDRFRDVFYFSDANQVRVFSLTQNKWLPSIVIPAPQGAAGPQRLLGIAISFDGTKLAVADAGAVAVYVIRLDQNNSIQSYPYGSQFTPYAYSEVPTSVAISNSSVVYIATSDLDGDGGCGFLLRLDPFSGVVSNVGPASQNNCLPTQGGLIGPALVRNADGTRIYFSDGGILGYINTVSNQVTIASNLVFAEPGYEMETTASYDRLFADGFFEDANMNNIGMQTLNIAEGFDAYYYYGGAFSSDGTLFFQPGAQAIDVFDGVTGAFRARVALPMPLCPNFRALISNNKDNRIIAITGDAGDGIAVIDLSQLPPGPPSPWLSSITTQLELNAASAQEAVLSPNAVEQRKQKRPVSPIRRVPSPLLRTMAKTRQ